MLKVLRVGDPHVKVANLDESKRLLEFVLETARLHKVDRIEILGDLFHTHAVLRLEVLEFWAYWLETLAKEFEVIVLVGNHDQSGDYNSVSNALSIFTKIDNKNLHIIETPQRIGKYGYLPYIHDASKFIDSANGLTSSGATILVCHQTFNGAKFESGMYAPDGIDIEKVDSKAIISGHIHSTQEFDKVFYPGTARWDTLSDANQTKGIWIFNHNTEGGVESREFISTENVCEPLLVFEYREGDQPPIYPENARVTVELIGTSEWINKEKDKFKGKVGFKSKITDKSKNNTRKSGKSLEDFVLNNFEITTGFTKESLLEYMRGLSLV